MFTDLDKERNSKTKKMNTKDEDLSDIVASMKICIN